MTSLLIDVPHFGYWAWMLEILMLSLILAVLIFSFEFLKHLNVHKAVLIPVMIVLTFALPTVYVYDLRKLEIYSRNTLKNEMYVVGNRLYKEGEDRRISKINCGGYSFRECMDEINKNNEKVLEKRLAVNQNN